MSHLCINNGIICKLIVFWKTENLPPHCESLIFEQNSQKRHSLCLISRVSKVFKIFHSTIKRALTSSIFVWMIESISDTISFLKQTSFTCHFVPKTRRIKFESLIFERDSETRQPLSKKQESNSHFFTANKRPVSMGNRIKQVNFLTNHHTQQTLSKSLFYHFYLNAVPDQIR